MTPLKVLVVGVSWPMETFIARLLIGLSASGLSVTLMSHGRPPSEWLGKHGIEWVFGPEALTLQDLGAQSRRNGPRVTFSTVADQVRRRPSSYKATTGTSLVGGFDVIYAPWINTLTERPELFTTSTPVVTSCRGALVTIAPWNPDRGAHRDALPGVFEQAQLVHCVSETIVADAEAMGLDPNKARVVRPAVDPDQFAPSVETPRRAGALRILGVGTLNWRKDYEHALLALRGALNRGADLTFDVIGDGPAKQQLQYAIDDLGLTDRVKLLGRMQSDQVRRHLGAADIFMHTSSSEGISNAVLEAMASGLAVVTTDAGGMREAVRDGVDGFVVGVRDATATTDALVAMAEDSDLRGRLGASARQRIIDHFHLDQQIQAFSDILHEAAGR